MVSNSLSLPTRLFHVAGMISAFAGRPVSKWSPRPALPPAPVPKAFALGNGITLWHMPVGLGPLQDPVGTNVGNPHATFFVDDLASIPITELGPKLEHDPFFPERVNVGVAQIIGENKLKLSVWERGAGETLACGTGACAAAVSAIRQERVSSPVRVRMRGGEVTIAWQPGGLMIWSTKSVSRMSIVYTLPRNTCQTLITPALFSL